MRRPSTQSICIAQLAAALAFVPASHARAAPSLSVDAARVSNANLDARGIHLRLTAAATGDAFALTVEDLRSTTLGLEGRLEWSCVLRRESSDATACEGPVAMRSRDGEGHADLRVRVTPAQVELQFAQDERSVSLEVPITGDIAVAARLQRVPATWLRAPLAVAWSGGEVRAGVFDARLQWRGDGSVEATYAATGVRFNTYDGSFAADELAAHGTFATSAASQTRRVAADARFDGGTLRIGSMRVALPSTPVTVGLDARVGDDAWAVDRFSWRDPGTLEFEAHGAFAPAQTVPLRALSVTAATLVFPQVKQRYAADLFASYGIGPLVLAGSITGTVDVDAAGMRRLTLATAKLNLRDATHSIAVDGLAGGIDWVAHGKGAPMPLSWRRAKVAGAAIGAMRSNWQARDGALVSLGVLRANAFGGTLELERTVLHPFAAAGERLRSRFAARGLGYDGAGGTIAAARIGADGELSVGTDAGEPRIRLDARLHGGEALFDAFYVELPATPVTVALDIVHGSDRWRIVRMDWSDPGALAFAASGEFAPSAPAPLQALQVDLREAHLAPALRRYAQSWLATRGYADLVAGGSVAGSLQLERGKLRRFALDARDVSIRDGAGRFAIDGLDGAIDWDLAMDRPPTRFGWRSVDLFRVPFGAARAQLASLGGAITLVQPLAVELLGGQIRLERFTAQPRSPRGDRYAGSFALGGIEMARVSDVLGWPRFPGKLSGGIPEIEFVGERIEFHGGLDLYAFDGHLGMSGLALERPFGVAPSLTADAHFENLDLEQVTSAFSFGGMSGRLFGTIDALRLVDWSPVAFDAWLRTEGGGRMSYKAVDDLTSIGGGGGLSSSLQTMALKIFDTFGYRRLGIRCVLRDDVCAMGGIDPTPPGAVAGGADSSASGYTIVEGSGLPRIMIVGHRRRVDWPTLVRRLSEATHGDGPIIE